MSNNPERKMCDDCADFLTALILSAAQLVQNMRTGNEGPERDYGLAHLERVLADLDKLATKPHLG